MCEAKSAQTSSEPLESSSARSVHSVHSTRSTHSPRLNQLDDALRRKDAKAIDDRLTCMKRGECKTDEVTPRAFKELWLISSTLYRFAVRVKRLALVKQIVRAKGIPQLSAVALFISAVRDFQRAEVDRDILAYVLCTLRFVPCTL